MNQIKKILLGIIFLSNACMAQIAGNQQVYSLQDALRIAAERNPRIRLSQAQIRAAGADVTSAFGQFLPSLQLNSGYTRRLGDSLYFPFGPRIEKAPNATPNLYNTNIFASYDIFTGFSREANYNRAQNSFDATDFSSRRLREDVSFEIHRNYINVLRNSQILKTRKENFSLGQKELERVRAMFEVGKIPINPVYAQEADLGTREFDVVSAENQLNITKANLLATMGLAPDQQVEFLESSFPASITEEEISRFRDEIKNKNFAFAKALEERDDYKASESQVKAAESSVTASSATYYPQISASLGWNWNNIELSQFNYGNYSTGLNLNFPIFDNFQTQARVANAKLQLTQRELEQVQLEQSIRTEIQTALLNLDAAEKQLEISQRSLRSAEQNAKGFSERYNLGLANVTEYLTANNQFLNAQINRLTAVYNYLDAQIQVRYAMGTLRPVE